MERTSETGSRKFSIKVEAKELDRIIQSRKNLDDVKALAVYASHYRKMGWSPLAFELLSGADLQVDFAQPQAKCLWSLMDLALQETRIGLAIRLDAEGPLFVLRIKPALGRSLDRLGNWRSNCLARLGDVWEHHFLMLPQTWCLSPEHIIGDKEAPLSVMGPGQLVAVPPTMDPSSKETWHWLASPWEEPPWEPSPELLILLEDCGFISKKGLAAVEALPTWKEIYPHISHSERLLQALLAPEDSSELYCGKILQEAVGAGVRDLELLLGLIWHAPHSEMRFVPEGREQLAQWAEHLQGIMAAEAKGAPEELESEAAESSPEELMQELQVLADQTLELEQQLGKLEDLRSSPEPGSEGGPQSLGAEPSPPPAPELLEDLEEFEELRQAVEDFLAGIKNLSEEK